MTHYCREASRLISDGYERELGLVERGRLRMHLWMCGACSNYRGNLALLERMFSELRRASDEQAPCLTEQQRQHIMAAVQAQADTEH